MSDSEKIMQDESLRTVALELMYHSPRKWKYADGATALEIARKHSLNIDLVKKKLKILLEAGLVRPVDLKPKRWQFDEYNYNLMDTEDPIYILISRYDDDDYFKFAF